MIGGSELLRYDANWGSEQSTEVGKIENSHFIDKHASQSKYANMRLLLIKDYVHYDFQFSKINTIDTF